MKRIPVIALGMMVLVLVLSACVGRSEQTQTDDEIAAATATAEAMASTIPTDVPIREGALNLKLAANNTYISYEVLGTVDEIVEYYKAEMLSLGWEKRGASPEAPIGGAITLLRYKPEKNVSVTIQSIPKRENVRVLITVIPK